MLVHVKTYGIQYVNRQGKTITKLFRTVEHAQKAIRKAKKHALSSVVMYRYAPVSELCELVH